MNNYLLDINIDPKLLYCKISSLLLYQSVFADEIGSAFVELLKYLSCSDRELQDFALLKAYSNWFKALAQENESWQDYLIERILLNDNPFSKQAQITPLTDLPDALITAVQSDLEVLQIIFQCQPETLSQWVQTSSKTDITPIAWTVNNSANTFLHQAKNWPDSLELLAHHYRQYGTGMMAQYRAFCWQSGQLLGITNPDPIELTEIVGYETQKESLIKNTEFLLNGYRALHVLLYGSRGNGKSSLVKGLLNAYSTRGLRLIEVSKSELKNLPVILEKLRNLPQKFILFVDDLSFEEDDDTFKALKVVLEGSITAKANNVVVYATSNRRHLIREFFDDRPRPSQGEEVHTWDTVQEKLSFSDRFGLTLTFESANQDTYLEIVRHLAQQTDINLPLEEIEFRAKQWATRHNGRSGRTARQFIDFLQAELGCL